MLPSHLLLSLGVLLISAGIAGLYIEHWRRRVKRNEEEIKWLEREVERKRQELRNR
jgi:hypothetical protein